MKRAERGLEKILDRERRAPTGAGGPGGNGDPFPSTAARASEAVGVSVPAGSENGSQLQTVGFDCARKTDEEKVEVSSIAGGMRLHALWIITHIHN